jgi:glucosyl-3-phosphoglycerate synthase
VHACLGEAVVQRAVVVDGGSTDGTVAALEDAGVEVLHTAALPPGGPQRGKGDSVRRATDAIEADRYVLVDGDLRGLGVPAVRALRDALDDERIHLAKASFDRLQHDGTTHRELGGRVTELLARPLLHRFAPDLDHVHVPLSGQQAVRGETLRSLPLLSGYGLEVGLLLAVRHHHGAASITDVPIPPVSHDAKSDASLVPMAHQVLAAAAWALGLDGTAPLDATTEPGAGLRVLPPLRTTSPISSTSPTTPTTPTTPTAPTTEEAP